MIHPDLKEFKRLSKKGNLIAVSRQIPADLETPVSSFLKLARHEPHAYLLESAEQEEKIGRYSFIGLKPAGVFSSEKGKVYISKNGRKKAIITREDLLGVLEKAMKTFRIANPETLPGFCGGLMGYLSYEQVKHFESVRLRSKQTQGIPDGVFYLSQELLIFDHFRKIMTFAVIVELKSKRHLERVYRQAIKKIDGYIHLLDRPVKLRQPSGNRKLTAAKSNMSRQAFREKVKKIKAYIRAGDCIQTVLSQRFTMPATHDDFQIYRALRSINPSPYMFYFRHGKMSLIGSSPELLVKKTGREAEIRPIAGTRPRGETDTKDLAFEDNLKRSKKEMAEHLMLVDLGRNDLGRVCDFKTVKVKDFARVERFSHVMHLVSDVTGKIRRGKNAFDLLRATFPAGTVTGAPKIRAMQIIDELESETRGPYAGSLGFFSFDENMDMCITIRTLVHYKGQIHVQAGAGIVNDSNPDREYEETVNKAKALMKAIESQREA